MIDLLKKLMLTPSVSGREDKIREVIKNQVEPYADEVIIDPVGNLIAHKKGNGKKIMFCAHMDEIGFFANYITDKGFIKISSIGGISYLASAYTEVVSEKGVTGVLIPEKTGEIPKAEAMYIDIGAKNKKQAESKVEPGDFFVVKPSIKRLMNQRYIGRPFDDRVGCGILIEALKQTKSDNDLYFVFSVQEEVGSRGAKPATYTIKPDIGIALDVTATGDRPGDKTLDVSLGKGCAIKIKDDSVICNPTLVKEMRRIAEENGVKYQNEVLLFGGTDTSVIQTTAGGCVAGAISIPSTNIHSSVEMIDMVDVKEAVKLTVLLANNL